MAGQLSLQGAIEAISSERLTDRTSGLTAYKELFTKERVLRNLHGNEKTWLAVFKAHFECIINEREACLRKKNLASATTAAINRLKAAAASLRWLFERSVRSFQRPTAKQFVNHIIEMLTWPGELLTPIVLDYLKALRILLTHRGHRNSVDADQWIAIASICFNIVHGRTPSASLPLLDIGGAGPSNEGSSSGTRRSSGGDPSSSKRALGLEDIEEMACLEELMSSPVAPLNDHNDKMGLRLLAQYGFFLSSFPHESTAHLPALAGLNKLLREIEFNQSSAMRAFAARYWDPLCLLWETKSKAVKEQLVITLRILFPYLIPSGELTGVEQDDLARLRSQLVFLQKRLDGDGDNRFSLGALQTQHLSMRLAPGATLPFQSPVIAAGRTFPADGALSWAALELASDVTAALIRLHAAGVDGTKRATEDGSKEAGPSTATAGTENGDADDDDDDAPIKAAGSRKRTTTRARTASRPLTSTTQSPRPDTVSPAKRMRLEESTQPADPVSAFIDGLIETQGPTLAKARATRLWRLQLASFFIARHFTTALNESDQQRLATRIIDILGDGDHDLQSWAFICLAALLGQPRDCLTTAIPTIENVWTLCCRRVQVAAVSRQAALAASALLQSKILDKRRYLPDLRALFNDLDLAAPPFPFDSVCDFFSSALDLCSTDVAMAKAACHSQVAAWLATVWSPAAGIERGFRTRGQLEEHDSDAMVALLCRLCKLDITAHPQQRGGPTLLPGNAIVEQIAYETETKDLRAFSLKAALSYERQQEATRDVSSLPEIKISRDRVDQGHASHTLRPLQGTEQRVTSMLKRAIEALTEQWRPSSSTSSSPDEGPSLSESGSVEQTRRTLDLITTTLLFQAHLSLACAEGDEALATSTHALLRIVMGSVSARDRWSVSSRSTLLAAIAPLVSGIPNDSPVSQSCDVSHLLKALVRPGPCSGVRQDAFATTQNTAVASASSDAQARSCSPILIALWTSAARDAQKSFLRLLRQCLHTLCDMPADEDGDDSVMQNKEDDDDDWGPVRQAKSEAEEVMKPAKDYGTERFALTASIALCVNGLVAIEYITRKPNSTSSNHLFDDVLLSGPLVALDRVARPVFAAFAQKRLEIDEQVATQVMERLGTDYLPDYEYKLDEDAMSNVVDFCEASMDLWLPGSGSMDPAGAEQFGEYFVRALDKRKAMTWRVKARAGAYLEVLLRRNVESTQGWTDKGDADPLCSTSLLLIVYGLMQEEDIRVRFASTTMIARLFDCVPQGSESDLYDGRLTKVLTSDWINFEGMLTRLLTLSNVMIRSSPLRASALFHIIEPFVARLPRGHSQHEYLVHAKALFAAVSDNLGFSAPTDLFKVFAAQITFGLEGIKSDPTRLPWAVLGYTSSFHCLEHNFMAIGSMMAAIGLDKHDVMPRFATLVRSFGKTEKEGVADCLPVVAAIQLVIEVALAAQPGQLLESRPISQQLQRRLTGDKGTGGFATQKALQNTFTLSLDRVIVETLAQYAELEEGTEADCIKILEVLDKGTAKELAALSKGIEVADAPTHAHVPHRPVANAFQIYQTLRIVTASLDVNAEGALAYHVIHQMLSLIWKERLVNDQLRHLQALRLFVAMKSEAIGSDGVVLRALLHGCSILMGQPDLLQLASGIASWCFKRCAVLEKTPSPLSTILITMAEKASSYVTKQDVRGDAMFDWLGAQVLEPLLQSTEDFTSKHAFVAVCAFPRQLPDALNKFTKKERPLSLEALTDVLVNHMKASVNVHLLMRFREALASANPSQVASVFARTTIWHLFTRLRSQASAEEARVIADILFALKDKIQTPSADQYQIVHQTLGNANAELSPLVSMLATAEKPYEPIKVFVAFQLLRLQRGEDLALAETAFHRLRAILTQDSNFLVLTSGWPDAMSAELALVAQYPTTPFTSPQSFSLANLAESKVDGSNYDVWIRFIATELCKRLSTIVSESFYAQILDLVATVTPLAAKLFAPLLHAYLYMFQESGSTETSVVDHTTSLTIHLVKVLENDKSDRQSWAAIINALLYLRTQQVSDAGEGELGTSDHWLSIDFLLLAKRSIDCRLYSTALLWCELQREHQPEAWARAPNQAQLLYEVYSNIEDPDSFYGVQHKDLRASLVRRLHHEEEWRRAFELHAADYESTAVTDRGKQSQAGIGQALHQMGFDKLASSFGGAANDVVDYDIAWRTEDWNLPAVEDPVSGSSANVFSALRALHQEQDVAVVGKTISNALATEVRALSGVGVEAVSQVRRVCRDLMSLGIAQQWNEDLAAAKGDVSAAFSQCSQWQLADQGLDFDDYERITTIRQSLLRSQRHRLQTNQIGDLLEPAAEEAIKTESTLLLRLCRAARKEDRQQAAMNAVTRAQKLCDELRPSDRPADLTPEFASVLWTQGEQAIAIQALSETIESLPKTPTNRDDRLLKAKLLAELGNWRATARSQQPRAIDETLFRPAHALVQEDRQTAECAAVCYQYAVFADDQYRALRHSAEVQQLETFVNDRREELRQNSLEMSRVTQKSETWRQLSYHRTQAEKILRQDEALLAQHTSGKDYFLRQAFKMYASAMKYSTEYDGSVVRLTSLWFENAHDDDFNEAIRESLIRVPSHKWLPLTHQLSSRLSKYSERSSSGPPSPLRAFHVNVSHVMSTMCQNHPFHSLYAIYALRKADFDAKPTPPPPPPPARGKTKGASTTAKASTSTSTSTPTPTPSSLRAAAAHELWDKVKANSTHRDRVIQFEYVCDAYVEWAELDLKRAMPHVLHGGHVKSGLLSFRPPTPTNGKPSPAVSLKLKKLDKVNVPVATADLAVDPTGAYRDMVTIVRYSDMFSTAGGIHLPKIVECIGSNGLRYKQLFKADDDLRQDAVMQQVFRLLNDLLTRDRKASQRHLRIRTYAVLPLGPQCGLLEFVVNTCPIGEALWEAHELHRKDNEWTPAESRAALSAVMGKTPSEKLEAFRSVCRHMPPAFRHYFMERFKTPPTWLAVRLNYTRSVATTSIIGHVLGLGDRHVSNILVDKVTGEVIHIDFGVAFEQGKLLPIPELVPFRLTRDIVDGMGLSGVEGVFRRCCEETLRVLRSNKDVIQTVLEVFKYDPLFAWTTNPVKILQAQRGGGPEAGAAVPAATAKSAGRTSTPGGTRSPASTAGDGATTITTDGGMGMGKDTASLSAERAIGTVVSKLSTSLSVQTTVTELIQSATDEGNLSAIFHGWQAGL